MSKLKVAAYCRVSSDHEEQESSLIVQKAYYEKYIQNNKD
jgi:site-specific DNA recombinase